MEVHHHTHHPKKWKEYFWEFLMLFLAVFCGFLAEYQLEHKIESERNKKYMRDLVENLKYDTIRFNKNLLRNELRDLQLDSLRTQISLAAKGTADIPKLYDYWFKSQGFNSVVLNKTTITQLKNSGAFRLIADNKVSLAVGDYYERIAYAIDSKLDEVDNAEKGVKTFGKEIFQLEPFATIIKSGNISFVVDRQTGTLSQNESFFHIYNKVIDSLGASNSLDLIRKE
ncbi:MAG: hypothetical protein ACK53B_00840, partial [Bacteroidota bacterium]